MLRIQPLREFISNGARKRSGRMLRIQPLIYFEFYHTELTEVAELTEYYQSWQNLEFLCELCALCELCVEKTQKMNSCLKQF